MRTFLHRHRELLLPVFFLFAALVFAAMLPPAPVWITDCGNKYMLLRNIAAYHTLYFSHPVPELFPLCGFHFQQLANGGTVSFFTPLLAMLTAPLWQICGDAAVKIIPLAGGVVSLYFLLKLSHRRQYPAWAMILTAPWFFYAVQLWEMLPAAALTTGAAWMLRKNKFLTAGIIFGCAAWFREETFVLGGAFAAAMLIQKRFYPLCRFAAGAAIPVAMLCIFNYALYGHILGVHGVSYFVNNRQETLTISDRLRDIGFNCYQQLFRFETGSEKLTWATRIALITAAAAGAAPDFRAWKKFKITAALLLLWCAALCSIELWLQPDKLMVTARTAGLFISFTGTMPVLLNWRALLRDRNRSRKLLTLTLFIFILAVPPLLNPDDIGLSWGSRHYVIIMPLLALLGFCAITRCRWSKIPGMILAVGLLMQLWSMHALHEVSSKNAVLEEKLLSAPEKVVVSDLFFLPEMTPHLPSEKIWLEITDMHRTVILTEILQKTGTNEFILLLSPTYRRVPNQALHKLFTLYPPQGKPEKYTITPALEIFIVKCAKKP